MLSTVAFVFGILVFLISVVCFFTVKNYHGERFSWNWTLPLIGVVLFGVIAAPTVFGSVGTKKVGVVTVYNKPTGEVYEAGGFSKAPWKSITEMDAAIQTATYTFDVQMAGGATATLNVYPSWEMKASAAPELFQQFKDFNNVVDSLFEQQLVSTANNLFGTYNPLTNVDPKTGDLIKTKEQWGVELKQALENNPLIKDRLIIHNVSVPIIKPDDNTQSNLNKVVAEFAKGSILDQQKANALKEKAIADQQVQIEGSLFCMRENSKNGLDAGTCLAGGKSIIIDGRKK